MANSGRIKWSDRDSGEKLSIILIYALGICLFISFLFFMADRIWYDYSDDSQIQVRNLPIILIFFIILQYLFGKWSKK